MKSDGKDPIVLEEPEDMEEEQPLVGDSASHIAPINVEPSDPGYLSFNASSPSQHDINGRPQLNGHAFQTNEV